MFKALKQGIGKATQTVGDFVKTSLSSHKSMENTATAVKVTSKPLQSLTFASFQMALEKTLFPPDETDPVTLSGDILEKVNLCVQLAAASYKESSNRVLPPHAGHYIIDKSAEQIGKISYFMTLNEDTKTIFVVCRGSYCFNDFITDAMANAAKNDDYFIHSGFFTAAHSVMVPIHDLLLKYAPGNQIIFIGHSLGAAVAGIVADMFAEQHSELNSSISTVLFAPPASISKNRWNQTVSRHMSFILGGDCVPFLSLHNIASLSSDIIPEMFRPYIEELVRRNMDAVVDLEIPNADFNPFEMPPPIIENEEKTDSITSENTSNNSEQPQNIENSEQSQNIENSEQSQNIENQINPDEQSQQNQCQKPQSGFEYKDIRTNTSLFPEGSYYHLSLSGETIFQKVSLRKIRGPEYFGRFVLGMTEEHHQMCYYVDAIAQLLENASA